MTTEPRVPLRRRPHPRGHVRRQFARRVPQRRRRSRRSDSVCIGPREIDLPPALLDLIAAAFGLDAEQRRSTGRHGLRIRRPNMVGVPHPSSDQGAQHAHRSHPARADRPRRCLRAALPAANPPRQRPGRDLAGSVALRSSFSLRSRKSHESIRVRQLSGPPWFAHKLRAAGLRLSVDCATLPRACRRACLLAWSCRRAAVPPARSRSQEPKAPAVLF
jgi:hypothetical protein